MLAIKAKHISFKSENHKTMKNLMGTLGIYHCWDIPGGGLNHQSSESLYNISVKLIYVKFNTWYNLSYHSELNTINTTVLVIIALPLSQCDEYPETASDGSQDNCTPLLNPSQVPQETERSQGTVIQPEGGG